MAAQPRLEGIGVAREVLPNLGSRTILHAGPPIAWQRMGGRIGGAVGGAILYEGWAEAADAAAALAKSGDIQFEPCHPHAAVGPMSGIISPSMPVWIVANATHGNRAFSNLNEGLRQGVGLRANRREGAAA